MNIFYSKGRCNRKDFSNFYIILIIVLTILFLPFIYDGITREQSNEVNSSYYDQRDILEQLTGEKDISNIEVDLLKNPEIINAYNNYISIKKENDRYNNISSFSIIYGILLMYAFIPLLILFIYTTTVVNIKRLHDLNQDGSILIPVYIIVIFISSVGYFSFFKSYILLSLIFILGLGYAQSHKGNNKFSIDNKNTQN